MKSCLKIVHAVILIIAIQGSISFGYSKVSTKGIAKNSQSEIISWQFETGGAIYATPVISDGVIYVGSLDGNFYAVDAQTGTENWQYTTENPIQSTAAIYENTIFFESGNALFSLGKDGNLNWKFTLSTQTPVNQIDSWDLHHSSPNVVNGVIYIGAEQGLVYGIDANGGAEIFQIQTSQKETIRIKPEVYQDKLIFGDWAGVMYAYDANTQEKIWEYDTRDDNKYDWTNAVQTPLVFEADTVYFAGRSCNAYALNINDGQKYWMYHDTGSMWIVGGTAFSDNVLYYGSSNQYVIYAIDATTGQTRWTSKLDQRIWGAPLVIDDNLYVGSNSLYLLDKNTGEIKQRLYFDPNVVHPDSITLVWHGGITKTAGNALANIHSSPVYYDGKIYFGCDDGSIYAVDQQKFLNRSLPKTGFWDDSRIELGDIPNNNPNFQAKVMVYNTGDGADLISAELNVSASIKEYLQLAPENFTLAAHDSQALIITINTTAIPEKKYSCSLIVNSYNSLDAASLRKPFRFTVVTAPSGIQASETSQPTEFRLQQNYPNPFNASTKFSFSIPEGLHTNLKIFNALGELIKVLENRFLDAGNYEYTWQAENLSSGVYFYSLTAGDFRDVRKMVLLE